MSYWSTQGAPAPEPLSAAVERRLRLFDLSLALPLLLLCALPLWLARSWWRWQPVSGRQGHLFCRAQLRLPRHAWLAPLRWVGLRHWPTLLHIVSGEMAWCGPRPRGLHEETPDVLGGLRPGLFNSWTLRRHTGVAHGDELAADLEDLERRCLARHLGLMLRSLPWLMLPTPEAGRPIYPSRLRIGRVRIDNLGLHDAVACIVRMARGQRPRQVCFVNAACVNQAAVQPSYRAVLQGADLVLADGIGMRVAGALLSTPVRQNVNGSDLFPLLCEELQREGLSLYLLGGRPGVAAEAAAVLQRHWPALRIAGHEHGYWNEAETGAVIQRVREARPDVLLVALGVPTQEQFIAGRRDQLGVPVALGVGALLDFVAGRSRRAPVWMRDSGLEWLWRLVAEPKRLWRRYVVGNPVFLARVLTQCVAQRVGRRLLRPQAATPGAVGNDAGMAVRPVQGGCGTPTRQPAANDPSYGGRRQTLSFTTAQTRSLRRPSAHPLSYVGPDCER